jgi:hypothetical protein
VEMVASPMPRLSGQKKKGGRDGSGADKEKRHKTGESLP